MLHCSMVRFRPRPLNFFCNRRAMAVDACPEIKLYNSPCLNWLFGIQLFMQLPKSNTIFQIFIGCRKIYFRSSFGAMAWLVVTVILLLGYAGLIVYYYGHFKKLPLFAAKDHVPKTFVSVLIAARNEEKTLPQLLKALSLQTYPQECFEIIVIDDFSTDNTAAV